MAKIGLKNLRYSVLDANDNVTTASTFGKAIERFLSKRIPLNYMLMILLQKAIILSRKARLI